MAKSIPGGVEIVNTLSTKNDGNYPLVKAESVGMADGTTAEDNIKKKLDKNQGTQNNGKFMRVGADGNLVPDDVPIQDVSGQIKEHNENADSHQDIRTELKKKANSGTTLSDYGITDAVPDSHLTDSKAHEDIRKETAKLKEDLGNMSTATDADVGKALKVKNVNNGKVTEWEFGKTGVDIITKDNIQGISYTGIPTEINEYYNLFDKDNMIVSPEVGINSEGIISTDYAKWKMAIVPVKGNTEYSMKSSTDADTRVYAGSTNGAIGFLDVNKNKIGYLSLTGGSIGTNGTNALLSDHLKGTGNDIYISFTTPSNCKYICFNTNILAKAENIQLEQGDKIHRYYLPYTYIPDYVEENATDLTGCEIFKLFNGTLKDSLARAEIEKLKNSGFDTRFSGKNWAVFGDSLSQPNTDGVDKYYNYVARRLGMSVTSYAVGGSGYFAGSDSNIYNRIMSAADDYNVVSMMAGVNESGRTLGDVTDAVVDTPTTLCGAFKKCLEAVIEKYPTSTIFVMTSIPGTGNNSTPSQGNLHNYSKKIIEICEMYNIPCLDLFHKSGLRPWNTVFASKHYRDHIHMLTEGHELISHTVESFMKTLFVE